MVTLRDIEGDYEMRNISDSQLFNTFLLLTIIGEFLLPWILGRYYNGYNSKTMVMSALGNPQSPVRLVYNAWLIWIGCFFIFTAVVYFIAARKEFPVLSVLISLSIGTFAAGAGVISGIFSVNENKDIVTIASKIHGVSAAMGFMALLFFPLLNGIFSLKQKDVVFGIVSIISFILALGFFTCFVMGDKEEFKNTVLRYEGLWQRMTLLCMYVPFAYKAIYSLLF